jgi:hypothetical protein
MKRIILSIACCVGMLAVAGGVLAQGKMEKPSAMPAKAMKATMSTFLIESPHTEAECMGVMESVNKSGAKELAAWDWGCMAGNHTAYRMVKAADENAALAMVPAEVREKAHVYKLTKMTPAMLEEHHKQKM